MIRRCPVALAQSIVDRLGVGDVLDGLEAGHVVVPAVVSFAGQVGPERVQSDPASPLDGRGRDVVAPGPDVGRWLVR